MRAFFNSQTVPQVRSASSRELKLARAQARREFRRLYSRMKLVRLLCYLALGFAARALALFFFGSGGVIDYRSLEAQKAQLSKNIEELEGINATLLEEQRALASDPERLALQARELGYFRKGERVVELGAPVQPRTYFSVGRLTRVSLHERHGDWIIKLLGISVPVALFVVGVSRERRQDHAHFRR
jgi:cell division protein FtsB